MGVRTDASLTVFVLAVLVGVGVWLDAPRSPVAVSAGVMATLLLEAVLIRHRQAVRRVWDRPSVRALSVLGALSTAGLATVLLGPVAVTVGVAAATTYLLFLGVVVARRRARYS